MSEGDDRLAQIKLRAQRTRDELLAKGEQARRDLSPVHERYTNLVASHPLTVTYATTFSLLAALPIGIFLLYALFVSGAVLACALTICFFVVGSAFAILLGVLIAVAFTAAIVTSWIVGLFLAYRAAANISQSGNVTDGLQAFTVELRGIAAGEKPAKLEPQAEFHETKPTLPQEPQQNGVEHDEKEESGYEVGEAS